MNYNYIKWHLLGQISNTKRKVSNTKTKAVVYLTGATTYQKDRYVEHSINFSQLMKIRLSSKTIFEQACDLETKFIVLEEKMNAVGSDKTKIGMKMIQLYDEFLKLQAMTHMNLFQQDGIHLATLEEFIKQRLLYCPERY